MSWSLGSGKYAHVGYPKYIFYVKVYAETDIYYKQMNKRNILAWKKIERS